MSLYAPSGENVMNLKNERYAGDSALFYFAYD